MVGAIGGGISMGGPGMMAGVGGPGVAPGVAGAVQGGTANRVGTTPAAPVPGTRVSISAAARKALAMDNDQAKTSAPLSGVAAGKTASVATSTASTQAANLNASTGTPASTVDIHINAGSSNFDINAQVQDLSDSKFWDDLIAALLLALLFQDKNGNGA